MSLVSLAHVALTSNKKGKRTKRGEEKGLMMFLLVKQPK